MDLLELLFLETLVAQLETGYLVYAVQVHFGVEVLRTLEALRLEELVDELVGFAQGKAGYLLAVGWRDQGIPRGVLV